MSTPAESTRPTVADLVTLGRLSPEMGARVLEELRARRALVIAGAAGSGRSTLLNALLRELPDDRRVAVIEYGDESAAADLVSRANFLTLHATNPESQRRAFVTAARRSYEVIAIEELQPELARDFADWLSVGLLGVATLHAHTLENSFARGADFLQACLLDENAVTVVHVEARPDGVTTRMQLFSPGMRDRSHETLTNE